MGSDRRLAGLRAPQVSAAIGATSIAILPIGAIEQHGPHLPIDTDLVIAERVAVGAVDRVVPGLDCWILPSIAYSKSDEHAWSPATIWISARTLLALLEDVGRSVARMGFGRLVLFNGHGGNSALLSVVLRELRTATGLQTFLAHPILPPDRGGVAGSDRGDERGMGIHGGVDETSLMLALAPDRVDLVAATRNVPEHLADNRFVRFGGAVPFGWLSNDFGPDGHIGDPTAATADYGEVLFEAAVSAFVDALHEIAEFRFV